jgi:hypothetical protein
MSIHKLRTAITKMGHQNKQTAYDQMSYVSKKPRNVMLTLNQELRIQHIKNT